MTLELRYLVPYLPYGLKGICTWEHLNKDFEVELYGVSSDFLNISNPFGGQDYTEIEDFKPILRPLSDLTKEIEHNGEKFIPIDLLEVEGYVIGWNGFGITMGQEEGYSFGYAMDVYNNIIQKLLEWHFDVFNLREKDLCIYYNEL